MKKIAASLVAGALTITTPMTHAEEESDHEFSANVGLFTDYIFRGLSQTNDLPAIQGGFDYSYTPIGFYAGVWASNVDFEGTAFDGISSEIDLYAGFSGEIPGTGVGFDIGALYYLYPGDTDDGSVPGDANADYYEVYAGLSYSFADLPLEPSFGVTAWYSPDFFGETGDAYYVNPSLDLSLPYEVGFNLSYGYQDVADLGDYSHINVGLSKDIGIFSFGVNYNNNFDEEAFCGGDDVDFCEDRVVGSVSVSF